MNNLSREIVEFLFGGQFYQDEDGIWICEIEEMPGCVGSGATKGEAAKDAKDAAIIWLRAAATIKKAVKQ